MLNLSENNGYSIDMLCLVENPEWIIPRDGKYLVQTVSNRKSHNLFVTTVNRHYDEKKKKCYMSFDCNNQVVTHISAQPFSYQETNQEIITGINKLLGKYEDTI
jgi:hypothetical protein